MARAAVAALALSFSAGHVLAQSAGGGTAATAVAQRFDLSAQRLDLAIAALASQSGARIVVSTELTQSRQSQAVQGNLTVRQALERLSAGSGLVVRELGDGGYTLVQAPAQGTVTLGTVTVAATAERSASTEGSNAYTPRYTNAAKGEQSLREIPQSITVVTQQRMQDQALRTLDEVMAQTTGVTQTTNWNGSYNFYSRGLAVDNIRYDGGATSSNSGGFASLSDMALYDNVGILRGADGLFGAGEAGGVLLLNHKRPLAERQVNLAVSAGSWNNYRAEIDATGPLAFEGRLRGRAVAVHQDQDYFYDYGKDKRNVFYGALETDLTPDTVALVGASYQKDKRRGIFEGLGRNADGSALNLPRSVNTGTPWNMQDVELAKVFAKLEHRFDADWKGTATLQRLHAKTYYDYANLRGPIDANGEGPYWAGYYQRATPKQTSFDANLTGSFKAWGQRHDVVVGADVTSTRDANDAGYVEFDYADSNVYSGLYPSREVFVNESQLYPGQTYTTQRKTGLYGSLRIRPIDRWSVIVGGRYVIKDRYRQYDGTGELGANRDEKNVWVPYAGLVFDLTRSTSLYASASEIYQSQADQLSGPLPGSSLDPITGRNYELGVKSALWDGKLNGSFALYRVEKRGAAVSDPAYPESSLPSGSSCCYFRDGYQLSQGFETELSGEVLPGLQLSAGYTYNANQNKRENDEQFNTVTPRHLFKLWANQTFSGQLHGLQLGAGVTMQSRHYQSGAVTVDGVRSNYDFTQGGYAVWGARAEYAFDRRWSLALNVNNLFDKTYFHTVSSTSYGNFYGAPRSVLLTLRAKL
ncbi:outer membrane receptor for ferric coprogen and ferric-rhodotorulic acid [Comamonas sp. BIGb0124]|uniref:TonB-dependent siderophore receptor n=1 Tax=Comamonas sp. BIGb0124 TaxID=2485130 RepID=UPI000F4AAE02|nr:TonB-dependent siderophore receptor [Comamonas sp. BIGb0124]ROR16996.1 outer membrane receptor for ferric coprogen and ferric-rhodotorulic acid [Comamonas sp. BIGb0124]